MPAAVPEGAEPGRRPSPVVMLVLLGTVLGMLESALPRPIPFVKPGLANVAAVSAVMLLGLRDALRVNITRSIAVALLTGTLVTPAFPLSMAGGLSSAVLMWASRRLLPGISTVATSVCGSAAGMAAQLLLAGLVIRGLPVASLVLPAAGWAVVSGAAVGVFSAALLGTGGLQRLLTGLVQPGGSG